MTTAASPKVRRSERESKEKVLEALRAKQGKATIGDLVVATGLPKGESEAALKDLLGEYESHLAVDEKGEILYLFEPSFMRRGERGRLGRSLRAARAALYRGFVLAFKVAIMVTLVAYFALFVVLIIAAIVAMMSGQGNRRSSSSRGGGGLPLGWLFWFWGGPRYSSGYYDDDYGGRQRSAKKADEKPFYKKVFAFVFGPEAPRRDPLAEERALLAWIRAQKGRITAADLASRTGASLREAEEEATKLLVDYLGDVEVTEEGTLVYTFKDLLASAGKGDVAPKAAYWSRFESRLPLTGNSDGTNYLVGFFNAFNLVVALSAPAWIFPALHIYGLAAFIGLVYFPVAFSAVFFAVPILRAIQAARENRRRAERNLHRAGVEALFAAAEKRPARLAPDALAEEIKRRYYAHKLDLEDTAKGGSTAEVERLLHAFEGDPKNEDSSGAVVYDFDRLSRELADGAAARKATVVDESKLGAFVYRTDE